MSLTVKLMDSPVECSNCLSDKRRLLGLGFKVKLTDCKVGNWISLDYCNKCNTYWLTVPHEPYASFILHTRWDYSVELFEKLNKQDNALILHEFHNAVIREDWKKISSEEIEAIEYWRKRSYGHNAIDINKEYKYISKSHDIEKYS